MQDGKHVILYVEDDPDFRDAMRQILEANGYVMVEAASAEDGLRTFKEAKPDLVGFWDADLATPLGEIDGFVARFESG